MVHEGPLSVDVLLASFAPYDDTCDWIWSLVFFGGSSLDTQQVLDLGEQLGVPNGLGQEVVCPGKLLTLQGPL